MATLDGDVNAQIRPQVSGYLIRRRYQEGAFVHKGDVLFEIDRRPFEVALTQATARLAEAQAQLAKAERDLARDKPLAEQRAIAQSQLDNDVSAQDAAQAAVASAKAAVEAAQLNLGFTRVTSLIDGVAAIAERADRRSRRAADAPHDGLPGRTRSRRTFRSASRSTSPSPTRSGSAAAAAKLWQAGGGLTLLLADGSTYPQRGSVLAVDRDVDPKMGTIRVSATLPQSRQHPAARVSTAASAPRRPSDRTRCWCRSARSPSCRAVPAARRGARQPGHDPHGRRSGRASATAGSSRRGCKPGDRVDRGRAVVEGRHGRCRRSRAARERRRA